VAIGITATGYLGDTTVISGAAITATADSYAYGILAATGLDGVRGRDRHRRSHRRDQRQCVRLWHPTPPPAASAT
jgi:hypothetical protein